MQLEADLRKKGNFFLDKEKKVVELKKSVKPFSQYFPKKKAATLVELESGAINKHKIRLGQKVFW